MTVLEKIVLFDSKGEGKTFCKKRGIDPTVLFPWGCGWALLRK